MHDAFDGEIAAHELGRRRGIASAQGVANPARRDTGPIDKNRRDRFGHNPVFGAKHSQEVNVSAASHSKGEIIAGDHAGRADALAQQLRYEVFRAGRTQFRAEFEHEHRICARVGEQCLPLIERRQAKRRYVGFEETYWVRVEGCYDDRPSFVETTLDRAPDHRLVTEVETVEIAEGDDVPLKSSGMPPASVRRCIAARLNASEGFCEAADIRGRRGRSRTGRKC